MATLGKISSISAAYRLVGVITIGVTKIPIVGFGYPEDMNLDPDICDVVLPSLQTYETATIDISTSSDQTDRLTWRVYKTGKNDISTLKNSDSVFSLFLNIPMDIRSSDAHANLFSETAISENAFLVAVTIENKTFLYFYNIMHVEKNESNMFANCLTGQLNKYVSGKAVPLLRTIERLQSQVSPQRKVEIPDRELGIIYQTIQGDIDQGG